MSMIAQKIYGATDLSNGNEYTEWYNNDTDFILHYDFPSGAYNKIMKYDFTPLSGKRWMCRDNQRMGQQNTNRKK